MKRALIIPVTENGMLASKRGYRGFFEEVAWTGFAIPGCGCATASSAHYLKESARDVHAQRSLLERTFTQPC
jgi:hypothetical protein